MKIINGVKTSAIIFNTNTTEHSIDDYAIAQIQNLCDNDAFTDCKIRVMPDIHPGKVGTIGFTSTLGSKVIPNVIGIDIGCGMTLAHIKGKTKDFQKLDTVIRDNVPSGFSIRKNAHHKALDFDFTMLHCNRHIQKQKAMLSLGTLGGGNHFIEVDQDEDKNTYLVIHSGSRHLGKEVTEYYLNEGQKKLKTMGINIPYELTYLDGKLMEHYLHDLSVVQDFATLNREIILDEICKGMKWKILDRYSCIHNYIDFDNQEPIMRKGAISAKKGEKVIIPINMRDGIILGAGLGNEDWNCSAPHGAGRLMSRHAAFQALSMEEFQKEMEGIYTTCVVPDTLDESPMAYKSMDEIIDQIEPTVEIVQQIRPVYNFKASD